MPRPAALLFDLDGTLVDSATMIASALTTLSLSRGGGAVKTALARRLVSKGAPHLVREALGPQATESTADVGAFREILAGIRAEPAMIFAGVVPALEALKAAGFPCAVVTNKPERLSVTLLEQLDLARFFAAVVGGDTLPVCKPDPAPLHRALALMAAGAGPAVMIGDSKIDARAAAAADMPFLLYEGGYEKDSCDPTDISGSFAAFADLPGLLRAVSTPARIATKFG